MLLRNKVTPYHFDFARIFPVSGNTCHNWVNFSKVAYFMTLLWKLCYKNTWHWLYSTRELFLTHYLFGINKYQCTESRTSRSLCALHALVPYVSSHFMCACFFCFLTFNFTKTWIGMKQRFVGMHSSTLYWKKTFHICFLKSLMFWSVSWFDLFVLIRKHLVVCRYINLAILIIW